ncbi:MAG: O-antigen ligase family protein [Anaerolineae bacterium]|nr:O-antigen ligase family protein [Anaerolineae bacterium]
MITRYSPEPPAIGRPTGQPENAARELAGSANVRIALFLLAHMPLAYAMEAFWPLATAHAVLVLLAGIRWAWLGRTRQVLYCLSYIAGFEVLWRMTEARVFWEYGKYALALVVLMALFAEWRRSDARLRTVLPVVLLAAMVPAVALAVLQFSPAEAFDQLSFNLSAYLALGAAALYCWERPVDRPTAANLLLALMAPIVGVLFLASFSTITQIGVDTFATASSWIRSGDFGANQVSNVLSLGALAGIILLIILPRAQGARLLIAGLAVAMVVQGILTFSRGGLYSLILAGLAFGLHLLTTPGARGRFLLLIAVFVALVFGVIYPWLNDLSTGAVTARFEDLDTTGRLELARADLMAFQDSPVLGAGVGGSMPYHIYVFGEDVGTHTEYTRLLAEHGLFGILIMALMGWMLLRRYLGNAPGLGRAISAAMAIWTLSVMAHSATRIVVIPFALVLAFLAWRLDEEREPASLAGDNGLPAPTTAVAPTRVR